jgi:hypothetical protein
MIRGREGAGQHVDKNGLAARTAWRQTRVIASTDELWGSAQSRPDRIIHAPEFLALE